MMFLFLLWTYSLWLFIPSLSFVYGARNFILHTVWSAFLRRQPLISSAYFQRCLAYPYICCFRGILVWPCIWFICVLFRHHIYEIQRGNWFFKAPYLLGIHHTGVHISVRSLLFLLFFRFRILFYSCHKVLSYSYWLKLTTQVSVRWLLWRLPRSCSSSCDDL